jgi:transcriptional regulator with XRE-family HTH domain
VSHHDPEYRRGMRRLALGGVLQLLRDARGWSVEAAAREVRMGHMTWRRVEDGFAVRRRTYATLDGLLEVPLGTVQRALNDDPMMLQLAARVVDPLEVASTSDPAVWVETFAQQTLSGSPRQAAAFAPPPAAPAPAPLVTAVGDLVTRLAADPRRSSATERALRALLDLMPELGVEPTPVDGHRR